MVYRCQPHWFLDKYPQAASLYCARSSDTSVQWFRVQCFLSPEGVLYALRLHRCDRSGCRHRFPSARVPGIASVLRESAAAVRATGAPVWAVERPRWICLVPGVGLILLLLQGTDEPPAATQDVLTALHDHVLAALRNHEDLETAWIVTMGSLLVASLLLVLSERLTFV